MEYTVKWLGEKIGRPESEKRLLELFPEANLPKLFYNFGLESIHLNRRDGDTVIIRKEKS